MRRSLVIAVRMAVVTIVALGLVYPAVVWGLSTLVFPRQASGSLVKQGSTTVGSSLVGQQFTTPAYFHSRPSAAGDGYDAMASAASNLGPTSRRLVSQVASRVAKVVGEDGAKRGEVPVDLVTASGSGLDPDISPDAAYLQVARVARERGLPAEQIRELVDSHITPRQLGFLGEPRVNVLEVNLALDALSSK